MDRVAQLEKEVAALKQAAQELANDLVVKDKRIAELEQKITESIVTPEEAQVLIDGLDFCCIDISFAHEWGKPCECDSCKARSLAKKKGWLK